MKDVSLAAAAVAFCAWAGAAAAETVAWQPPPKQHHPWPLAPRPAEIYSEQPRPFRQEPEQPLQWQPPQAAAPPSRSPGLRPQQASRPFPGGGAAAASACNDRFRAPRPGSLGTDLNGVALEDTCIQTGGPHHIFVIGDWGGVGDPPRPADHRSSKFPSHHREFVLGVDDRAQQRVADQMSRRAAVSYPDYIINVGDNFYWGGVDVKCGSPTDRVRDYTGQWEYIFENMYEGQGLDGIQWLGVLGNHDYGGYYFTAGWDQVIGYTWAEGAPSRGRWLTPAQYWRAKVRYPDFSVDYFFVDSNVFDAQRESDEDHGICSRTHNPRHGASCGAEGPSSVEDCPGWFDKLWQAQLRWLDDGLTASAADWQVVVTHFPPTWGIQDWAPMAAKHGIDLIITGHVHRQAVQYGDTELGPTAFIISGGGGGITSEGLPDVRGDDDQYGFMDITLTKHELMIEAISHGGQVRSTTCVRPRQRQGVASGPTSAPSTASLCQQGALEAQAPQGASEAQEADIWKSDRYV